MQTCNHDNSLRLMDGWYCPDCGEKFDIRPRAEVMVTVLNTSENEPEAEVPEPKPKATRTRKTNSKSAAK